MSVPRASVPPFASPRAWNGQEPGWFRPTIQALQDLLQLPENWNSYGARPIVPELAATALDLLLETAPAGMPPPIVVPTTRGGVLFEWHLRGIDLEIDVLTGDRLHVFYEDAKADRTWEGELSGNTAPIAEFLGELSRRA